MCLLPFSFHILSIWIFNNSSIIYHWLQLKINYICVHTWPYRFAKMLTKPGKIEIEKKERKKKRKLWQKQLRKVVSMDCSIYSSFQWIYQCNCFWANGSLAHSRWWSQCILMLWCGDRPKMFANSMIFWITESSLIWDIYSEWDECVLYMSSVPNLLKQNNLYLLIAIKKFRENLSIDYIWG